MNNHKILTGHLNFGISVQLHSLKNENKLLVEKLQYTGKSSSATMHDTGGADDKEMPTSNKDMIVANMKASEAVVSPTKSIQAGTLLSILLLYH